jgi:hypothetical protein
MGFYTSSFLNRFSVLLFCGFALSPAPAPAAPAPAVDYNHDIRPILSENCFACHGPDAEKRKAGLRLDQREGALAELKSGNHAVVPGQPAQSALLARITTTDDDDRMPPLKTGKHLTTTQIELLRRWIAQGAEWKNHWSFITPQRPALPRIQNKRWPQNPIDDFILARLEKERLIPETEANKVTLIRRVTLDLTGLPPTPAEVDAFLADRSPDAYEKLVERLLASARYGEHMARYWLDAARYGDTHGLHLDNERSMWPYRDWVIGAFNRNLPFDQFTIEQLAGDLLPDRTRDQQIASGFNRCNVSTSEGGAIDEEFYVRYAVDRTETTSTIWMGLTVGCAVCHDHKYDPISQKEFYQLYAFFNNVSEKAMDGNALLPPPILKLPSDDQAKKLAQLNQQVKPVEEKIRQEAAKIEYREPPERPKESGTTNASEFVWVDDELPTGANAKNDGAARRWVETNAFSGARALARTDQGLAQDYFTGASQPLLIGKGDVLFAYVYLDPADPPKAIMLQYHTSEWLHRGNWGDNDAIPFGEKGTSQKMLLGALPETGKWVRLEVPVEKLDLKPGAKVDGLAFTQFGGTVHWDKAGLVTATPQEDFSSTSLLAWEKQEKAREGSKLPRNIMDIIKLSPRNRSPEQRKELREYYVAYVYGPTRSTFDPMLKEIADLKKQRDELENALTATMVSEELTEPRVAYLLKRGEYDKRLDPVQRGVPGILPPLGSSSTPNRLDLARWLVAPRHPLTARVIVNRLWQQFFGTGLVKTSADFGAQGESPNNPDLLDWLACEFRDGPCSTAANKTSPSAGAWDVQHMVRLMVTSAAYRQDSRVTPEKLHADPENRWVSRGPRFRLDGEVIRDSALYVSRLLVEKIGGRGVRPYQPEGIWEAVGYTTSNTAKFSQDKGEALYRRSLYTFWKRTAPPPSLITFDAPSRERFCVRRERTDTPLQALVTMNDPQFVEASRHFAAYIIESSPDPAQRLDFGFRTVTSRHPNTAEKAILRGVLEKHIATYQKDPEAAKKLIAAGDSPVNEKLNASELAAYAMVANLLLNLDETLNKN